MNTRDDIIRRYLNPLVDYADAPQPALDALADLLGEIDGLRDALRLSEETIRGLADQQAMPDDFYRATLARIDGALRWDLSRYPADAERREA